jgi:hypothetical protein
MQGLVPRTVLLNNNIAVPNPLLPNADRDKGVTLRRIPSLTALPHWQLRKGACRAIQTRSRRCARDNLKVPFLALDHSHSHIVDLHIREDPCTRSHFARFGINLEHYSILRMPLCQRRPTSHGPRRLILARICSWHRKIHVYFDSSEHILSSKRHWSQGFCKLTTW